MSHSAEALLGWLILVGMLFGGGGILLFALYSVRAVGLLVRRIRIAPPEVREAPVREIQSAPSR